MSNELIAILCLGVTTPGVVAALTRMSVTQILSLRTDLSQRLNYNIDAHGQRLDDQVIELREIKTEVQGLREAQHGLIERMAHLEGLEGLVEGFKKVVVSFVPA